MIGYKSERKCITNEEFSILKEVNDVFKFKTEETTFILNTQAKTVIVSNPNWKGDLKGNLYCPGYQSCSCFDIDCFRSDYKEVIVPDEMNNCFKELFYYAFDKEFENINKKYNEKKLKKEEKEKRTTNWFFGNC